LRCWPVTSIRTQPRGARDSSASPWRGCCFFPNAPYILTDLIHLTSGYYRHFWVDLTLFLLCAFTGLVLGFVSLYLMQSLMARSLGRIAGWLFVIAALGLSSFGVYLGRFLRFNSWDVLRPGHIFSGLNAWLEGPMLNLSSGAFLVLFATFLFVAYVMLYALTLLSPTQARPKNLDLNQPIEA
jgi:uncharacterized membrane protein